MSKIGGIYQRLQFIFQFCEHHITIAAKADLSVFVRPCKHGFVCDTGNESPIAASMVKARALMMAVT